MTALLGCRSAVIGHQFPPITKSAKEPRVYDEVCSPEELDTDPMLLNVENGTINLKTGALRMHRPEDLITKLAPVEFDVTAASPTFDRFLKQVLVDKELIAFVQRYLGYSLTGLTKERAMAVLHGVGKNGKSTLVELFIDLLGNYSATADPNTLMQQRYNDATSRYQLADLTGVRFVGMSETKRDVKLEESVVKQVTGTTPSAPARRTAGRSPTARSSRSGCPRTTSWISRTVLRLSGIGCA